MVIRLRHRPGSCALNAFLVSTGIVSLTEIGGKTQLLALVLATRFRKPLPIALGILLATLVNHALAGALGAWITSLIGTVRGLSERIFEFSTLAVKNRIHSELLRLAREGEREGKTARISPAPTHADIASRISTHREAVTREPNDLTKAGLLKRDGRTLIISDLDELERLVHEVSGD